MGCFMSTIRKAYLAGLCIGMGGVVYLMCANMGNPYVGALIFSTGLFTILNFGLKLFTGAVGYFPDKTLPHIWLGNLLGTATVGIMMLFTRSGPALSEKAASIVAAKMADTPLSIFILSIFCGILMYIAVDCFRSKGSIIPTFLCVPMFILCGFEHCIANMFYFTIAKAWTLQAVIYLVIMTLGNGVGAILFHRLSKMKDK